MHANAESLPFLLKWFAKKKGRVADDRATIFNILDHTISKLGLSYHILFRRNRLGEKTFTSIQAVSCPISYSTVLAGQS